MTPLLRIATLQLNSRLHLTTNQARIQQLCQLAAQHSADLIVLPENACGYGQGIQPQLALQFDSLKAWYASLAQSLCVYIVAGTLPCPYRPDGSLLTDGRFRQACLIFSPTGDCIARYDKIHLFQATVDDTTGQYQESDVFESGTSLVCVDLPWGKLGLMICYDLRFAEHAIQLRQLGADVIAAPSAFTYQTGKAHWRTLITARALDSQCAIVGSAQAGTHPSTLAEGVSRQTWGHSMVSDAWGHDLVTGYLVPPEDNQAEDSTPILQKSLDNNEDVYCSHILLSDIDLNQQHNYRQRLNIYADRSALSTLQ